jgi:hypothetical protein
MTREHVKPYDWTSETAPRQGGKPGRKQRLNAQSLKVVELLLDDFAQHGKKVIDFLRIEKPDVYLRVIADVAAKLTILDKTGQMTSDSPPVLVVNWPPSHLPAPKRIGSLLEDHTDDDCAGPDRQARHYD